MKFSLKPITALLGLLGLTLALPPKVTYDGVKVVRVDVGDSADEVAALKALVENLNLALWTDEITKNTHVDLEVPKYQYSAFIKATEDLGLQVSVMHEDLGAAIRAENENPGKGSNPGIMEAAAAAADITFFNNYHPYSEHLTFLKKLVARYPTRAEIITAGNSAQGRPITGIHIFGGAGKGNRPAIIFHGTVHAREWITTMVNQYFAYYLLTNYASNPQIKAYVDKYDFYIFPVVNPDGFVYTQTTQRLWRKNRVKNSGSSCVGIDINRNWAFKWEIPGGASTDPCSETYKGRSPGDTPEFKALSSFQNALAARSVGAKLFIDWHAYSQLFMSPYGYSCTVKAADNTELVALAQGYANAARVPYGTTYQAGPICTTIYQATGSSVDYSYDVSKIKYSFTTELRDTGAYGFVLPASQIMPTAVESWAGLKYLLDNMK
ncbi:hypothetical protein BDZ91DRAFT_243674 [Kalaharituber pfeilii]|nr:hypothetical protein BDZ91DRAFT_243674 [Kalaharituber pfeilii]